MMQEQAAGLQQAMHGLEIGREVGDADMFEHADGGDLVETILALDQRVVAKLDGDAILEAEAFHFFLGVGDLLLRQRHAKRFDAIVLCRVTRQRAPAAAHIENGIARFQAKFAADHVELLQLHTIEIVAPVMEVGAGVDHLLVEPELIERVGDIVVIGDVFLVLFLRSVAFLVAFDGLQRPRLAARHEEEGVAGPQRLKLVERSPEVARARLWPFGDEIENAAVEKIEPFCRPKISQRRQPWLA